MADWPSNPESMVDIKQVASLYGITPKTVRRWVEIGRLPPPVSKGRWTWRAGAVNEFERALELVRLVRRGAKRSSRRGQIGTPGGQIGTSDAEGRKPPSRKPKTD